MVKLLSAVRILVAGVLAAAQLNYVASAAESDKSLARLEEIVVTAQKREQSLQDVPISIGVLTAATIADRHIVGLTQLTQVSPSINFNDGYSPVATSLSIRGINSYTFDGGIQPSVSIVVDGVPLARAGEFVQELADLDRVEVLRGPQGTLFGQNATGGAINIVRKRPTKEFEGLVEVSATNDDDYIYRGVVSGPITDSVRGRITAFDRQFKGFIRNFSDNGPSGKWLGGDDAYGAVGKLDVDFSDRLNVLFSADYRKAIHGMNPQITAVSEGFDFNGNGVDDRIEALGNGDASVGQAVYADHYKASVSSRSDHFSDESWGGSAELTFKISDGLRLKSVSSYRSFVDRTNPDVDATPADGDRLVMPIISVTTSAGPNCCQDTKAATNKYWSQEIRLEKAGDHVDWTTGAFYQDFKEDMKNEVALMIVDAFLDPASGGAALGGTPAYFDEYFLSDMLLANTDHLKTWAAFADATWHATDRIDVFGGLRYTSEDLSLTLNNTSLFAPLSRAAIASRFDSTTRVLDVTGLPVFPTSPGSIGAASQTDSNVSGRFGVSVTVAPNVHLYVSASRGAIGAGAKVSRTAVISSAFLKPSIADAYELGVKSTLFDNRLRLNAAVFDQKTKDLQTSRLIPGTTVSETINAGDLKSRGLEFDMTWVASDIVSVDAGLSWIDTKFENLTQPCYFAQTPAQGCNAGVQVIDGKPGIATPKVKYNVALNAKLPLGYSDLRGYGSLGWVWQDKIQFNLNQDPLTVQDAYGLLDLTLGVQSGHFDIALFGKNLLDKDYIANSGEAFGALGRLFVRPSRDGQRYFGVKAQYKF